MLKTIVLNSNELYAIFVKYVIDTGSTYCLLDCIHRKYEEFST